MIVTIKPCPVCGGLPQYKLLGNIAELWEVVVKCRTPGCMLNKVRGAWHTLVFWNDQRYIDTFLNRVCKIMNDVRTLGAGCGDDRACEVNCESCSRLGLTRPLTIEVK